MAEVSLFIAASLDGFIADPEGGVGWLFTDEDYGYEAFFAAIGAQVMGRRTYEHVLGYGAWPHGATPAIVLTTKPSMSAAVPSVSFASGQPADILQTVDMPQGKKLWLVGGAQVASDFARAGLIDEVVLSIHPVLLGGGAPLFEGPRPRQDAASCSLHIGGRPVVHRRRMRAAGLRFRSKVPCPWSSSDLLRQ